MTNEPLYDGDLVNLGYLNTRLGTETTLLLSKSQNFGTLPNPPYYKYNTYMGADGIYICVNERLIGEYNAADWTKASTYVNVDDAFTQGIITAGMLQAVNGGTNTAGLTGEGTGNDAIRFWAGSTYANRGSAPFMVTQGGAITASNIAITGGSLTWNNLNKPTKSDLGTWTTYIDNNGIYTGTLTANQVNAVAINANSITTGTLSTSILNSDVITTSNFSAQNINADKITSGTISGRTISGGSISINNQFKVNTSGLVELTTSGGGYLSMGIATTHPWLSGINVNRTNGIQFYDGTSVGGVGSRVGWLDFTGSAMYLRSNGTININNGAGGNVGIQNAVFENNKISCGGGANIEPNYNLILRSVSSSYAVYATGQGVSGKVQTDSGTASSKNVKTNFIKFDDNTYDEVLNTLDNMNLYSYDYKYNLYKNRHQYGFIIDEIEEIPNIDKYFTFETSKAIITDKSHIDFAEYANVQDTDEENDIDIIEVKKYDPDVLDKYILTICKAQQIKINDLEERIKKLEEGGR